MRLKTDMYTDMRNEIWHDLNRYYGELPAVPNFAPDLKETLNFYLELLEICYIHLGIMVLDNT